MPGSSERGKYTLPWSLLLLGSGYFLLVAGPLLSSRLVALRWVRDLMSGRAWLPSPAAAGTALLGAAALIYVVARLVREVEQRPYASIAPVLTVFSGFVLTSTRTELPLPGVGAAQLGILVLALGLLGGALIARVRFAERALGWLLAVLPTLSLAAAITVSLGHSDPVSMLQSVDAGLRTYLMLLAVSSLCLGLVGAVARNLVSGSAAPLDTARAHSLQTEAFGGPLVRLPRPSLARPAEAALRQASTSQPGSPRHAPQPVRTATLLGAPALARPTLPPPLTRNQSAPRVRPNDYELAQSYNPDQRTPMTGELALDDPDLLLMTRGKFPISRVLSICLALALAALACTYWFVVRPRQHAADLARVRSAALAPSTNARAAKDDDQEAAQAAAKMRAFLERTAAGATEPKPLVDATSANRPTVTSLEPAAAPVAALPPQIVVPTEDYQADKPAERAHRSHSHARHHRATRARSERGGQETLVASEPVQEPSAPAQKLEQKAAARPQAPAAAAPTRNEQDLDLDQLLHRAVKSSNGVNAQEDPILGL
ncbi:MAG: hypothetical protein JWN04_2451 [Myxococcaceae bacterium]|nr:hypothetical protein [Myxococcaceae bacterium]